MSAARRRARRRNLLILATGAAAIALVLILAGSWTVERTDDLRHPRIAAVADVPREPESGELGSEDGYVPVGGSLSPFSDEPAVGDLDPDLLDALRQAASDASADGIELRVNGGWRSARYQEELLQRAVATYGSVEAARQYVKPPGESSHVTGEAVDVGPAEAASWLSAYGSAYGLCQIYANEPWHFELATSPGGPCPALTSNAAGG